MTASNIEFVGLVDSIPSSLGKRPMNPETIAVLEKLADLKDGQILKFCFSERRLANSAGYAVRRIGLKCA